MPLIFYTYIFFIIAILLCVKWYLIEVLIFVSLITSDVEQLFLYILAICVPSFGEMSIQALCPFLNYLSFY